MNGKQSSQALGPPQAPNLPFDHPKRSYPVVFSLEAPRNIEMLQGNYGFDGAERRRAEIERYK